MSLMKDGMNCFYLLNMWSAKHELKSIVSNDFRNPEHFYINDNDGVIFECLILKNSPKNNEYFNKNLA